MANEISPNVAEQERYWRKALAEHAVAVVRRGLVKSASDQVRVAEDNGGLVVEVLDLEGAWRGYYVRLTEVAK